MSALTVVAPGPLSTFQDLGRPGYAHVGVPRSGAADRGALRLANRLVGNREGAAAIEATMGGLHLRAQADVVVAATGAAAPVLVNGLPVGRNATVSLTAGDELHIGAPTAGLRTYLAVRGGFEVTPVLGSCSTDTLSEIGPEALRTGQRLSIGADERDWPAIDSAPVDDPATGTVTLAVDEGPRVDRLSDAAPLYSASWAVSASSNRVGLRLEPIGEAPALGHNDFGELPSEGIAHGSVQVPPSGRPVIFLADHPVTGGYPVVAVLPSPCLDAAAQLTPGQHVRFRRR